MLIPYIQIYEHMGLINKVTKQEDIYKAKCKECGSICKAKKSELTIYSNEYQIGIICFETCRECDTYGIDFKKMKNNSIKGINKY